jgi:hypothetical protein
MSEIIILEVPFNEKDEAKSLGAKWDAKARKWYISESTDKDKFQKWIPKTMDNPIIVANAPIYLLKSWERCRKCYMTIDVFCLAANGAKEEEWDEEVKGFFTFPFLTSMPKNIEAALQKHAPLYYMDYTKTTNSYYYVNHCKCGAKLGDFYMHGEPGGAFYPTSEYESQGITMHVISLENITISASLSSRGIEEFIGETRRCCNENALQLFGSEIYP